MTSIRLRQTAIWTRVTFRDSVTYELIPYHVRISAVVHGNLINAIEKKKSLESKSTTLFIFNYRSTSFPRSWYYAIVIQFNVFFDPICYWFILYSRNMNDILQYTYNVGVQNDSVYHLTANEIVHVLRHTIPNVFT